MLLASRLKCILRRFGIEARRYGVQTSPSAQLGKILTHLGIELVFDVGAHEGQYGQELRALGYTGRIVSFEPLPVAHARLLEISRLDPAWEIAPRAALGDAEGEVDIHVSAHSLSSSILPMLPLHEQAVPGSGIVKKERVSLMRLDKIAPAYLREARTIFLKVDTQGYEDHVLRGASGVLNRLTAVQVELSLAPLYAGQPLIDSMRNQLDGLGFELFALFPGHVHETTGQTLQVDGLFVRRC